MADQVPHPPPLAMLTNGFILGFAVEPVLKALFGERPPSYTYALVGAAYGVTVVVLYFTRYREKPGA
jgi:hypothetical protein